MQRLGVVHALPRGVVGRCPGGALPGSWDLWAKLGAAGVSLHGCARPSARPKIGPNRTAVASAFSQPERRLANFHSGFARCWTGPDSMTYATTTLDRRGTKFPRFDKTGPLFLGGGVTRHRGVNSVMHFSPRAGSEIYSALHLAMLWRRRRLLAGK